MTSSPPPKAATPTINKGYLPGCIGCVTALHAAYYSKHAGFGMPFESKVARELAEFCRRYDDARDGLWLATGATGGTGKAQTIQGSIVIDGLHADTQGAHLRWFITADEIRGSGVGTALMSAAVAFCRTRDYRRVYLWTFAGLDAARHLYGKFGFTLAHQHRGSQWGAEVEEQRFELAG